MNPSPEQILQAIKNHQRPAQTAAARIRQALAHVRYSSANKAKAQADDKRSA